MKLIIDRFEGNFAVCENENKEMINIERNKIPSSANEGDVISLENNIFTIYVEETNIRKEKISKLLNDLWKE